MTYPNDEPASAAFPVIEPYDRPVEPTYEVVTGPPVIPVQSQYVPEAQPVLTAPARKRTAVVVLSIATVLLFGAGAAFGILYSNEKSRNNSLVSQLSNKENELKDSAKNLQDTKDDLGKAKDAVKRAEDAQKKAEGDASLSVQCRDAARALREAAIGDNEAKGTEAFRNLFIAC
jgi:hypothetical protein